MVVRTLVCLLLAGGVASSQAAPTVDDLRKKAGEYIAEYSKTISGVTLEEQFLLVERTGGNTRVPLRIASDMVLFELDRFPIGLRDIYAVDTRPVRERQPRVINALKEPAGPNIELVRRYVRENASHLLHNIVLWYTDPLLALQFGSEANQPKITYKIDGNKKINGVQVFGLGYKETSETDRVLSQVPGKAKSSGRLWVDPLTGAIHMTEFWVQSETDTIRIQVEFTLDKALKVLLPRRASHSLEWREMGSQYSDSVAMMAQKLSFEGNSDYKQIGYTPIK